MRAKDPTYVPRPEKVAPTTSATAEDIAYAAGFIEGEGCFSAGTSVTPRVTVNQLNREPLDFLRNIFGGAVRGPDSKNLYTWAVYGDKALITMGVIRPYFKAPARIAKIEKANTRKIGAVKFGPLTD